MNSAPERIVMMATSATGIAGVTFNFFLCTQFSTKSFLVFHEVASNLMQRDSHD